MIALLCQFVFLILATANPIVDPPDERSLQSRIVGGENATIEDYPHQVLVTMVGTKVFCGGSIIAPKWVLTAAHCLVADEIVVRSGTATLHKGGTLHQVVRKIPNEKYHITSFGEPANDIALLEVKQPFEFDETRQPIELFTATNKIEAGTMATVSGWGFLTEDGGEFPEVLQAVSVPIITKKKCAKAYRKRMKYLPAGQICALHPAGGKDACNADSGSPLIIDEKLAGVVSWGVGCGRKDTPGVYTEIGYFYDWVKGIMAEVEEETTMKFFDAQEEFAL